MKSHLRIILSTLFAISLALCFAGCAETVGIHTIFNKLLVIISALQHLSNVHKMLPISRLSKNKLATKIYPPPK